LSWFKITEESEMSTAEAKDKPGYAGELGAYHRAHWRELKQIVRDLPLKSGDKVLDIACGDGCYSAWLAERVQPDGLCVGCDLAVDYLREARRKVESRDCCELAAAKFEELPFARDSFDLVWCAQSLVSLPEPVDALRRMRDFVKLNGIVAVLENDALYQLILPWPEEIEFAIREAELQAYRAQTERPEKRYAGRRLTQYFAAAGLEVVFHKTYATDRIAPLERAELDCVAEYLTGLAERIAPFLAADDKTALDHLIDVDSKKSLIRRPDFAVTWIDFVCWGRK
jgi:ubiquinone/menaquinone biosynthesis C-methylase UbiE